MFPIVVFLAPGAGGLVRETYTEVLLGETLLEFHYRAVGLPELPAEEYSESENPLAVALSALMKSADRSRPERKVQALRRLFEANLSAADRWVLSTVVDQYLMLSETEELEMSQYLQDRALPEAYKDWIFSWAKDAERRGIERGIEQGIEQGIERGQHKLVLGQIGRKFGAPSPAMVAAVESITDDDMLLDLIEKVARAEHIDDLGFPAG